MTKTTLKITLECAGKSLVLGPGGELDISKVKGLESSEFLVGLSDLAVVDGSSVTGRHIKARPIHLEGSFRRLDKPAEKRETLVRFFNPKATGTLTAEIGETKRSIDYELEGWTLKEQKNLDARVGFVADLICPDPYFYGPERGAQFPLGYIDNDGDVETGWRVEMTGNISNPQVTNEETGEYMRVETTIYQGQTLAISTEDRRQTITIDGESAFRFIDRSSTPFKLPVGFNRITIRTDSGGYYGGLTFRPRYFGI